MYSCIISTNSSYRSSMPILLRYDQSVTHKSVLLFLNAFLTFESQQIIYRTTFHQICWTIPTETNVLSRSVAELVYIERVYVLICPVNKSNILNNESYLGIDSWQLPFGTWYTCHIRILFLTFVISRNNDSNKDKSSWTIYSYLSLIYMPTPPAFMCCLYLHTML